MILSVCPNPSVDKYLELPTLNAGTVNRSLSEKSYPGGKGVHVALAVHELDVDSSLLGFWGGPTGQWIKDTCSAAGVRCKGPEFEDWNRTCITITSESEFDHTEILEQGPAVTEQGIDDFINTIKQLSEETEIISISGSWPAGVPDNIYVAIKKILTENHQLWIDASGERLEQAVGVHPYGIHLNLSEAQALLGADKTPGDCASELLDYCSIAAVTNGADGLYLARNNELYHATCPVDKIISTVGSGDCLLAGLLVAEYQKKSLNEMATLGAACGTANCLREDLGMFYRKDVEHLIEFVSCEKLN